MTPPRQIPKRRRAGESRRMPGLMSEGELQDSTVDLAKVLGLAVFHPLPAVTAKGWRTALMGHPGFPDLVMAGQRSVVLAELKGYDARGRLGEASAEQLRWLATLSGVPVERWFIGQQVTWEMEEREFVIALWGPEQWTNGRIEETLRGAA